MASNTSMNVGVRRFIYGSVNGYRNFEPGGTTQYVSNKSQLTINGIAYQPGDALPLGCLPDEKLEVLFNAGDINPAS
jgi:hypothetical protein